MSQAPLLRKRAERQCLRLSGIDWRTYSRLLYVFAERPSIHLTYDRGELEIRPPRLDHDGDSRLLGRIVLVLTEELGLPLKAGGSTTLRRRLKRRGIEADDCFWIANAHRMAGRRRLDLRTDPPPDRLGIYAALQVPEVWRLEDDVLTFHVLGMDGRYTTVAHSQSFPQVTPADLFVFLQQARQADDENAVIRRFREWIRKRREAQGDS